MKAHFSLFAFALVLMLCENCPALAQKLMFNRVLPPRGSNTGTLASTQDPQGYMWFATTIGLHRYDGYNYVSYFNDPLNSNSLAGNWVETVYASRNGFIWIAIHWYGLDRLDPATGIFRHFRHDPKNAASLSNDTVTAILEDHDGTIWVGTRSGLNHFSPKTETFTRYSHHPADSASLSHPHVRALYQDRQGTIWVGTGSPFHGDDPVKGGGLNRLNRTQRTFTRYLHDPKNPRSLIDNRVRAIFEDSRGTFWIGTAGDGLHTMDRAKGTFERHRYDPANPESLSRPPQNKTRPYADDNITFIIEDLGGAVWIGTFGNGLNRYDPKTKKVEYFPPFKDEVSGIAQVTWSASASRDGVLWIGCSGSLFRIDPLRKKIPYFATGTPVEAICKDAFGTVWYGDNTGLVRKDAITGVEQRYFNDPRNRLGLSNNEVYAIHEDRHGVLWIGTDDGLNRFDRKTGTFTHYLKDLKDRNSLSSNQINRIYEDRSGNLWIGTWQGGLNLMNQQTGTFIHYSNDPKDSNSLSNNQINSIYEDRSGNLWIGTWHGALNRLVPQSGKIQRFLYVVDVTCVMEDSEGIIWVGTSNGLYRSNPTLNGFSRFSDVGMTKGHIVISGILEDNQRALWINTSAGILKLNQQRNEIIIYDENHGVSTRNFYAYSGYHKGKTGELFFGSESGYYSFFPEQLTGNTKPPQIIISDFRLADGLVVPGADDPLPKPVVQAKEIRLNHNQNVFSFDFAALHYSSPEENRHLFMLENLDNTWRKAGTEKTAYYYNVPPGRYIFRVKAANSDGVWAEKNVAVIITPAWWNTWWFRITAGIFVIAIIYGLIRWRLHEKFRLRLARSEKEKQVAIERWDKEKQLAKLLHQKTELEMQALRAQMNPHFIFNSLNSINRFILQNDKTRASEYLTKFSRLVRLILQNSQAELIPLETELEALQLYLELEKVRFDHHFEFKINVDHNLETDIIKVPPLIIQPYAENAIWHGLMHKDEKGRLDIEIFQIEDVLYYKIRDDGIGRRKAADLKSKSASIHKSTGMRITAERIAMLHENKQSDNYVQITDLILPDGSPGGTEVLLKIPVMQ